MQLQTVFLLFVSIFISLAIIFWGIPRAHSKKPITNHVDLLTSKWCSAFDISSYDAVEHHFDVSKSTWFLMDFLECRKWKHGKGRQRFNDNDLTRCRSIIKWWIIIFLFHFSRIGPSRPWVPGRPSRGSTYTNRCSVRRCDTQWYCRWHQVGTRAHSASGTCRLLSSWWGSTASLYLESYTNLKE